MKTGTYIVYVDDENFDASKLTEIPGFLEYDYQGFEETE